MRTRADDMMKRRDVERPDGLARPSGKDDAAAKRDSFREVGARLRRATRGRPQTPSEVLIREDRESGHREL